MVSFSPSSSVHLAPRRRAPCPGTACDRPPGRDRAGRARVAGRGCCRDAGGTVRTGAGGARQALGRGHQAEREGVLWADQGDCAASRRAGGRGAEDVQCRARGRPAGCVDGEAPARAGHGRPGRRPVCRRRGAGPHRGRRVCWRTTARTGWPRSIMPSRGGCSSPTTRSSSPTRTPLMSCSSRPATWRRARRSAARLLFAMGRASQAAGNFPARSRTSRRMPGSIPRGPTAAPPVTSLARRSSAPAMPWRPA